MGSLPSAFRQLLLFVCSVLLVAVATEAQTTKPNICRCGPGVAPCDEGCPVGGAARLSVVVGEQNAVFGNAVDVRRPAHHEQVGAVLNKLKERGVADNTIVIYSTDNGNELMFWPDGGYAPFRGEKGTTGREAFASLVCWNGRATFPLAAYPMGSRITKTFSSLWLQPRSAEFEGGSPQGLQDGRHDV